MQTSGNILLKGQGMQVMLILISVFFIRYYVSIAVVFVLWRRGRFKDFRPIKHGLGRVPIEKLEYIPEEDKIKYGRLISFIFLPVFLAAITLGWFLMAGHHCS